MIARGTATVVARVGVAHREVPPTAVVDVAVGVVVGAVAAHLVGVAPQPPGEVRVVRVDTGVDHSHRHTSTLADAPGRRHVGIGASHTRPAPCLLGSAGVAQRPLATLVGVVDGCEQVVFEQLGHTGHRQEVVALTGGRDGEGAGGHDLDRLHAGHRLERAAHHLVRWHVDGCDAGVEQRRADDHRGRQRRARRLHQRRTIGHHHDMVEPIGPARFDPRHLDRLGSFRLGLGGCAGEGADRRSDHHGSGAERPDPVLVPAMAPTRRGCSARRFVGHLDAVLPQAPELAPFSLSVLAAPHSRLLPRH